MKLITQQRAAEILGVTDRTIRNKIAEGVLTGYQVPGLRAVRVDEDEIKRKLQVIPAIYNGNVRKAPTQAVVVEQEGDR